MVSPGFTSTSITSTSLKSPISGTRMFIANRPTGHWLLATGTKKQRVMV
jgi:hypothetical protein